MRAARAARLFFLIQPIRSLMSKNCIKERAARAAQLFFLIQPIVLPIFRMAISRPSREVVLTMRNLSFIWRNRYLKFRKFRKPGNQAQMKENDTYYYVWMERHWKRLYAKFNSYISIISVITCPQGSLLG